MHEFGIAQGLLETVLATAKQSNASGIGSVKLEIGILCGVEEEALNFAFEALSEGTPAAGARLIIDKIPLRCHCEQCDVTFECRPFQYKCPTCGKSSSSVRSGKELNLISMEVN